jgi:hypothetical protein
MAEAFTPTAIAAPLDDYLREVVQTLHTADCTEILGVIMAGDVKDWLA